MALQGPKTQVIELGLRTLLPGLVEPHMHFVFTFFDSCLDLGPFANRSMDEVKPMVQEHHCPPGRTGNGRPERHPRSSSPERKRELTRLRVARFRARQKVLRAALEGTKKSTGRGRVAAQLAQLRGLWRHDRGLCALGHNRNLARFLRLGKFTKQIDVKQAVFKARAGHMHVIGELEPALDAKPASSLSPGSSSW